MAIIKKEDFGGGGTGLTLGSWNYDSNPDAPGTTPISDNTWRTDATLGSSTKLYIDDNDDDGTDWGAKLNVPDSSWISFSIDSSNQVHFQVENATDGTGYWDYDILGIVLEGTIGNGAETSVKIDVGGGAQDLSDYFNKTTDDTDDITESATKEFLDNSAPQVIDGNKSFTGQVKGGANTSSFSATKTFDLNADGNYPKMLVTANVTSLALSNKVNGSSYQVVLEIAGSGSYTIPQADASFGDRTNNSVDDSVASWYPTSVGSKIIYTIGVDPDGDTWYSIETITA